MPHQNIYTNVMQNVYATGFSHGRVLGYREGVEDTCALLISGDDQQRISNRNYLSLAENIQERIDKIMNNYELSNQEDIRIFFNENASSLALVNEAYSKIYEFIPETRKVTLEVLVDPEDNQKNLIAKINLNLPVEEAFNRLDNFDKQWFASKFIDSEMMFNISIDFEE